MLIKSEESIGPVIEFACIKARKFPPRPYICLMELNCLSQTRNSLIAKVLSLFLRFSNLTAPSWKDLA